MMTTTTSLEKKGDATTTEEGTPGTVTLQDHQTVLREIIHHIDQMYDLTTKVDSIEHQLQSQIATFGLDEVASTEVYSTVRISSCQVLFIILLLLLLLPNVWTCVDMTVLNNDSPSTTYQSSTAHTS
jgi:hypothetical protein